MRMYQEARGGLDLMRKDQPWSWFRCGSDYINTIELHIGPDETLFKADRRQPFTSTQREADHQIMSLDT